MGAEFSSLDQLSKNDYINRLVNDEHIDENDPFWNQLLSFTINIPLTKESSKKLDESIALSCQKFHQNNPKSGNYSSLIRVFSRRSNETRRMTDNKLMVLHTSNALFIIRCITKYMIEIENEAVLLEQINFRPDEFKAESEKNPELNGDGLKNQNDYSTDSSTASPKRLYNPNKNYRMWKSRPSHESTLLDSQENSIGYESDSDIPQNVDRSESNAKNTENILYLLIKSILQLCTEIPVKSYTYNLHLEALNTFLVLLSSQMYSKTPAYESVIFDTVMQKMDRFVSDFVKVLLKNIIQQMPPPSNVQNLSSYLSNEVQNQRSFMSSVASGLWSVMTLGLGSANLPTDQNNQEDETEKYFLSNLPSDSTTQNTDDQLDCSSRYVAWQSCHILLVLSNNYTNESLYNPYRLALFHFTDTQNTPTNLPNSEPLPWFSIDFSKLFQMFTHTVHTDQYSLLLYMLLHRNQHFKMFILSRLQIDLLVMPLLKVIFTAPERNSHHIYMTLIIILILSEDDIFNKSAHTLPIKKLTWYTERSLSEISLGGLLILVLIRTIQFNMTRMRDKYLHTNCLAALANMSSKFQNLHPYVCQRINSLFNMLTRKRTKIITQINEENTKPDAEKNDNNNKDLLQDLSIIEELMKMVLEIINSCLTNNLHHNSDLIYSILYHKTIYLQFRDHPTFQDLTQNIDTVITRFSHEIEIVEDKTIENLRELITMGAKQFSRERFRKFPELKFKYVEEDQPEEFFVPYVWSLVYKYSSLYWIDHSVDLFNSPKNQ